MPFVLLRRNPRTVSDDVVIHLRDALKRIVSEGLNVPGDPECELTEDHIDVDIEDDHPLSNNKRDIAIFILGNAHPKRQENIDERADGMQFDIMWALSEIEKHDLRMSLYITPTEGTYRSTRS